MESKKQLKAELVLIGDLINRYGGEVSLWMVHDNVAVALDLHRGSGEKPKRTRLRDSNAFFSTPKRGKIIKKAA